MATMDRVVVVTGAVSGMGLAIARHLAAIIETFCR
jgi:NAD(P)-dependent dehydrogenase (short-subunit alcohol dehydrogenase family)